MSKLILKNDTTEQEFQIQEPLLIGSDQGNAITLAEDDGVSNKHARVSPMGHRVILEDLDSLAGVRVNGRMVQRCALHHGDEIEIGDSVLLFEDEEPEASTPEHLGDYKISTSLGKTPVGEVFKALKVSEKKIVALKIFDPKLSGDAEFVRGFLEEAAKAKKLAHPGLVRYLDYGFLDRRLYLVMEHVEGESAQQVLEREGPLSADRVIDVAVRICDVLNHAKKAGVTHLDIRPMNILFSSDGLVKLVGMGLALFVLQGKETTRKSEPGGSRLAKFILGDPHYMASEQHGRAAVDYRSDIYSLGATMFYLLTGRPPFEGPPLKVISNHKMADRPNPCDIDITIPPRLGGLIKRMMAVELDHRPANPDEIQQQLKAIQKGKQSVSIHSEPSEAGTTATPRKDLNEAIRASANSFQPNTVRPPVEEPIARYGTSPTTVVAAVLGLIAIAGIAWMLLSGGPNPPTTPANRSPGTPTTKVAGNSEGGGNDSGSSASTGSGSTSGSVSGSTTMPPSQMNALNGRLRPHDLLESLRVRGKVFAWTTPDKLVLPPGKKLTIKCLLRAQLDPFTAREWKRAGLLDQEPVVSNPFFRTITLSSKEDLERLYDWHVESVAPNSDKKDAKQDHP